MLFNVAVRRRKVAFAPMMPSLITNGVSLRGFHCQSTMLGVGVAKGKGAIGGVAIGKRSRGLPCILPTATRKSCAVSVIVATARTDSGVGLIRPKPHRS